MRVQQFQQRHTVNPKTAKVLSRFTPGRQSPDRTPIKAAKRLQHSMTAFAQSVNVFHLELAARLHRFAQQLQLALRSDIGTYDRRIKRQAFSRRTA